VRLERELTDALEAQIVPQENFVCCEFRLVATTNECEDVCPEHHFDNADAAVKLYYLNLVICKE